MELKNKKVLVTGACGFIGSHLIENLLAKNCKIKAFTLYNSFNSWGWLDQLPKEKLELIEVIPGDIRNLDGLKKAFKGVDVVFHLAALIGIPYSYISPEAYIDTNSKGTLNVLQAGKETGVEKIILTSTSEVYGSAQQVPIREDHPLQAQSPYAASKIAAEKIGESFYLSFNTPVTIVRPFNTFGPRQSARAFIPSIIIQALSNSKQIEVGSLHPRRDLNYVADICEAFIEIAKSDLSVGKTINICSNEDISMQQLASLLLDLMNTNKPLVSRTNRVRPAKSEVERLQGNNQLISNLTHWQAKHSLKDGLNKTIAWFSKQDQLRKYKTDIYNI